MSHSLLSDMNYFLLTEWRLWWVTSCWLTGVMSYSLLSDSCDELLSADWVTAVMNYSLPTEWQLWWITTGWLSDRWWITPCWVIGDELPPADWVTAVNYSLLTEWQLWWVTSCWLSSYTSSWHPPHTFRHSNVCHVFVSLVISHYTNMMQSREWLKRNHQYLYIQEKCASINTTKGD